MKVFKENLKQAPGAARDSIMYIGTYTDESVLAHDPKGEPSTHGIHSFLLDGRTGRLTPLSTCDVGPNPAFLLKHPTKPIMWASTECIKTDGEVVTLEMLPEGKLKQIASQGSGGKSTCFLNLMAGETHMMVVSYWDAKVAMLPIEADGTVAEPVHVTPGAEYVVKNSPDRKEHWAYRQRWPHTHCSVTEPYSGRLHFVTDLGRDAVCIYAHDAGSGRMALAGLVHLRKQHGPRHIIFHPTLRVAYIVNELISSVTVLQVGDLGELGRGGEAAGDGAAAPREESSTDEAACILKEAMVISTLPEDVQNDGTFHEGGVWKAHSHCSEIRIDPEGRFVYVGNRGHDSIAVYAVDQGTGMLKRTAVQPSGGEFPRNFNFSSCGRYMVVGNQRSNNLTVFERDPASGALAMRDQVPVPSPNYVCAVPRS